jgi:hypothetical protein
MRSLFSIYESENLKISAVDGGGEMVIRRGTGVLEKIFSPGGAWLPL